MNIIEAAKALKEGKRVAKKSTAGQTHDKFPSCGGLVSPQYAESILVDETGMVWTSGGLIALFSVDGLLTDEWEVVDE